jgi:hypothetical protein
MTLHRALEELKLNAKKINKKIANLAPVGEKKQNKPVNDRYEEKTFCDAAKADFQSIQDLIKYQQRLKSAIMSANATTLVEVGGQKMFIIDAINMKTSILAYKNELLDRLVKQYGAYTSVINRYNDRIEEEARVMAERAAGKDNEKIDPKKVTEMKKFYMDNHSCKLVDPLGIENKIAELDTEIDDFEAEYGAALSEVNAITTIEV